MDASFHHHSHKIMLHMLESPSVGRPRTITEHDDVPPPYDLGNYIAPRGSKYIASPEDDEDEDMFSDVDSCYSDDEVETKQDKDDDDQEDHAQQQTEVNDNPHDTDGSTNGKLPSSSPPAYSSNPAYPGVPSSTGSQSTTQLSDGSHPAGPPRILPPAANSNASTKHRNRQQVVVINATTRIHGSHNRVTAEFAHLGARLSDRVLLHLTGLLSPASTDSPSPTPDGHDAEAARSICGSSRGPRVITAGDVRIVKTPTIHLTVNCGVEIVGNGNVVIGGQTSLISQQQQQRRDAQALPLGLDGTTPARVTADAVQLARSVLGAQSAERAVRTDGIRLTMPATDVCARRSVLLAENGRGAAKRERSEEGEDGDEEEDGGGKRARL